VTDHDGNGLVHSSRANPERWVAAAGPPPRLAMRYDRMNLNVHSVLEQLRSSEPLAPT